MDLGDLARAAWDAIAAVFSASPIGLLLTALTEGWARIREWVAGLTLQGEGASVIGSFIAGVVGRVQDVLDAFTGLWDAIVGAFGTGEADMTEVANGIWNAIVAVFRLTPAGMIFEWIAPKLAAAWDNALAAIEERGGLFASIGQGFEEDATLNAIVALWDKAAGGDRRAWRAVRIDRAGARRRRDPQRHRQGVGQGRSGHPGAGRAVAGDPHGSAGGPDPPGAHPGVQGDR